MPFEEHSAAVMCESDRNWLNREESHHCLVVFNTRTRRYCYRDTSKRNQGSYDTS